MSNNTTPHYGLYVNSPLATQGPEFTASGVGYWQYDENFEAIDAALWTLSQSSGGSAVSVNGNSVTNPNFNGTTPAAPVQSTNVIWQIAGNSISAYIPTGSVTIQGDGVLLSGTVTEIIGGPTKLSNILATQAANTVMAGPASGSAHTPTFRALVSLDIPANAANTSGTAANLSGTPALPNGTTATTQSTSDNSSKIATDAWVKAQGYVAPQALTNVFPAAVTSLQAFGDSITASDTLGLPTPALGWPELFCQAMLGIPLANNFAVDGARLNSTGFIPTAYQKTPSNSVGSITLGMTNDVSDCEANSSCIAQVVSGYQAFCVWLGLPASGVVLASAMSKTGTWSTTTNYNLTTVYSNTANSTLTGSVNGTTVYVAGVIETLNQSFSVTIDGANQGTFTFSGVGNLSTSTYPFCLRFPGLSAGSHTVVITNLSTTYTIIQWIAGNGTTGPFVAVGGALPQASYTDSVIVTMNSTLQTMINNLIADGLNVVYINDHSALTKSAIPPQYSTSSGANVHPNILGNIFLVAAWLNSFYSYSSMDGAVLAKIIDAAGVSGAELLAAVLTVLNQSPVPEGFDFAGTGQITVALTQLSGVFSSATLRSLLTSAGLNVTAQSAAQSGVSVLAAGNNPAAGIYNICWTATVTQVASSSSTLGGTNGFQVTYTDNDTGATVTTQATPAGSTNAGNTVGSQANGDICVNAKAGTAITVSYDYTSSGSTVMKYALHVAVVLVG